MNGKQAVQVGTLGGAVAWLVWQAVTVWYPVIPPAAGEGEMLTTLGALTVVFGGVFRLFGWTVEKTNGKS